MVGEDISEHSSGSPGYNHYIESNTRYALYHKPEGNSLPSTYVPLDGVDRQQDSGGGGDRTIHTTVQPSQANITQLQSDALHSMLLAWYHSGYATGRYEALRELESMVDPSSTNKYEKSTDK